MGGDDAQFLMASEGRLEPLDLLRDAPAGPRDLVEKTGLSRASVQRNLAAFVDRAGGAATRGSTARRPAAARSPVWPGGWSTA